MSERRVIKRSTGLITTVLKTTRVAAGELCRTIPLRSKDTLVSRIPRGLYDSFWINHSVGFSKLP
jgi:hypothetical protein